MATLSFRLGPLRSNLDRIAEFCGRRGLKFLPVTKVIQSRPDLLAALGHPVLARVADVHPENLAKLDPTLHPDRVILRPNHSGAAAAARHATRVFLSDPRLGQVLGRARQGLWPGKPLEVMVMVEGGDLRDGVPWEALPEVIRILAAEPGLSVEGLGVNFGCLAGAVPDAAALDRLADGLAQTRKATGHPLREFSLGGTVFWDHLRDHAIPGEFTELRVGEAAFFGWNTSLGSSIPELDPDVFRMDLEVLEVWEKNVPGPGEGTFGLNAFGVEPVHALTGRRLRAVLDGGENLAPYRALSPLAPGCILVGETHEYTVADVTGLDTEPVPGTSLSFRPGYEAVARSFLSPFLELNVGEEP
jgi:predicted amino acid racemase